MSDEQQQKLERQRIESEAKLRQSHNERVKLEEQISKLTTAMESLKMEHSIAVAESNTGE